MDKVWLQPSKLTIHHITCVHQLKSINKHFKPVTLFFHCTYLSLSLSPPKSHASSVSTLHWSFSLSTLWSLSPPIGPQLHPYQGSFSLSTSPPNPTPYPTGPRPPPMSSSVLIPSIVPAGPNPHPFPRHSKPLPPTLYLLSPSQLQGSIFVLILVWVCWVFVVDLEFTCR